MPIRLPFPTPQLLTIAWKKQTNLARCSYLCNNKYVQGKGWALNFTENYLGLIPMYILSQFQKKRNVQTPRHFSINLIFKLSLLFKYA